MNAFEFVKKLPRTDLTDMPSEVSYLLTQFAPETQIKRKNAAQLVCAFLKYVFMLPDIIDETVLKDIRKMKDVYDCPGCTHAIMQVAARRLMTPKYILNGNGIGDSTVIFGSEDLLSNEEASNIADLVHALYDSKIGNADYSAGVSISGASSMASF